MFANASIHDHLYSENIEVYIKFIVIDLADGTIVTAAVRVDLITTLFFIAVDTIELSAISTYSWPLHVCKHKSACLFF